MQLNPDTTRPRRARRTLGRALLLVAVVASTAWLPWWVPLGLVVVCMLGVGAYELVVVGFLLDVLYPVPVVETELVFTAITCGMVSLALVVRPVLRTSR